MLNTCAVLLYNCVDTLIDVSLVKATSWELLVLVVSFPNTENLTVQTASHCQTHESPGNDIHKNILILEL